MKVDITHLCAGCTYRGNTLVLYLLLKGWEGEDPTREKLAALAHISPRQAERDLSEPVADGVVGKTEGRGRGVKTRFYLIRESLSDVSDKGRDVSSGFIRHICPT